MNASDATSISLSLNFANGSLLLLFFLIEINEFLASSNHLRNPGRKPPYAFWGVVVSVGNHIYHFERLYPLFGKLPLICFIRSLLKMNCLYNGLCCNYLRKQACVRMTTKLFLRTLSRFLGEGGGGFLCQS